MAVFKIVGYIVKTIAGEVKEEFVKTFVQSTDYHTALNKANDLRIRRAEVSYYGNDSLLKH